MLTKRVGECMYMYVWGEGRGRWQVKEARKRGESSRKVKEGDEGDH